MTTQEKRDFNLTLTLESQELYNFLSNMDAEQFVKLHQSNFKDHYLSEPEVIIDGSAFDELGLADIIQEKYREFFSNMGAEAAYKWLNPSLYSDMVSYLKTEDFSMEVIKYEIGLSDELEDEDELEMFNDLYFDICSGWGLSWFVIEIVDLYMESKS